MATIKSIQVSKENTNERTYITDKGNFIVKSFSLNQNKIYRENGEYICNVYDPINYIKNNL